MFKQLRTRFIILTMTSVLAVLLIIMTAINLLNYRNVLRDSDRILSVLADNQGKFPAFSDGQMHPESLKKKISSTMTHLAVILPQMTAAKEFPIRSRIRFGRRTVSTICAALPKKHLLNPGTSV